MKHDGLCFRGEYGRDVARDLLVSDLSLLSLKLDDIAIEFTLVLRALRIVLAGWFCFDGARDGIAGSNVIGEIDFDLALRRVERRDVESVGSLGVNVKPGTRATCGEGPGDGCAGVVG